MKCKRLKTEYLRNEEWFQYYTEVKTLIEQYTAQELGIAELFGSFVSLYNKADEALTLIRKSATTEQLTTADNRRDVTFRGLVETVKSTLKHFDPEKQQAAKRLQIVLRQFGNVARKPYDQETASIYNLLQEMNARTADVTLLKLTDWLTQLDQENKAFDALMKNRYDETAAQTLFRMKEVRSEGDQCYRTMLDRIDALMLVNGTEKYASFIRDLTVRVNRFDHTLAQRKGRNHKDNKGSEG